MARYDFKSLSPQDFEEMIRDLWQAHWQHPLESFKTGRDDGIDLRYAPLNGGKFIIQCKHYVASGFTILLSHLKNSELPKIKRLRPDRYVVATSVAMSPREKARIKEVLTPFIQSEDDILSAGDIEGLLSLHPEIERANFKLWLTNTDVISRVIHNAEHCTTDFEIEKVRKKVPIFVQNDAYQRSQALLDKQRVLVISGAPGIGKTTLAQMLLLSHVEQGFEPVVLETCIPEGKNLFKRDKKQIFYYDDFLGEIFLGDQRQERNYDAALLRLIEMVCETEHSRFILTTREHILRQAFQLFERISQSPALNERCVVELSDYSFGRRARILYNHLYFSTLPTKHKEALLKEDFFLDIIKHEHFNPRLVEWLSSLERIGRPSAENYREEVTKLLNSPHKIWKHAFDNQLSMAGQDLLLTVYSVGEWSSMTQIQQAFHAMHSENSRRYQRTFGPSDYERALQELDGAFLTYERGKAKFLNPSVRDFVAETISNTPMNARDLLSGAILFRQLSSIWDLARARPDTPLLGTLAADESELCQTARRLMRGPSYIWEVTNGRRFGVPFDTDEERRLDALVSICETLRSSVFLDLCLEYVDFLKVHWESNVIDYQYVLISLESMACTSWFFENRGHRVFRDVLNTVLDQLEYANADDWSSLLRFPEIAEEWLPEDEERLRTAFSRYRKSGVKEEQNNCTDVDEMGILLSSLAALERNFKIDFDEEIAELEQRIAELEQSKEDQEPKSETRQWPRRVEEFVSEDDVREMFASLRN